MTVRVVLMFVLICSGRWVQAVQLSANGTGQVLIYPYYTVNHNLNTAYSVVNTTAEPKAIKVTFREGRIGLSVLSFNVYLDAYDVWTGLVHPSQASSFSGHPGEPSGTHISYDTSCTPYLNKAGQEFLAFEIDLDLDESMRVMERATEGMIEVIEMGVPTGAAADALDHGFAERPNNCALIQQEWDDNDWSLGELAEPSGGLLGSGFIVNVAEGVSFSFDAVALDDFWLSAGLHTEPGVAIPDLSSGTSESKNLMPDGTLQVAQWNSGYEAVSAVLTRYQIFNEYAYDALANGKSEWVVSFPTKGYHSNQGGAVTAPFTEAWDGATACEQYEKIHYDRTTRSYNNNDPCDRREDPSFCWSTNVLEILPGELEPTERSMAGWN
jgi:hypothetical protein